MNTKTEVYLVTLDSKLWVVFEDDSVAQEVVDFINENAGHDNYAVIVPIPYNDKHIQPRKK